VGLRWSLSGWLGPVGGGPGLAARFAPSGPEMIGWSFLGWLGPVGGEPGLAARFGLELVRYKS